MKFKIVSVTCLVFLVVFTMMGNIYAAEISGQEIMDNAEGNMDYGKYKAKAEMTIFTTSGNKRVLKMEMWGAGAEKTLMKYYSPARVEGVTFLFLNNDIWSYFPRSGRVRHLASHIENQNMMGSSFSYEDFSSEAFDDYKTELIREENLRDDKCYVVEGKAKNEDVSYERFIAWVTKKDFRTLQVNYFNEGQKVKVMTIENFEKINDNLRPKKIVMEDLMKDNKTVFEYLELRTGVEFNPNFFNKRNLKRISQK